ncbi:MAG: ribonuclease T2 [Sphingopyxis sp.]
MPAPEPAPDPAPKSRKAKLLGYTVAVLCGVALSSVLSPDLAVIDDVLGGASGQGASCVAPTDFAMPRVERPRPDQVRRTPVTRYTLALSWSPGFCVTHGSEGDNAMQCGGEAGRFGFVLHGLWPETSGRDWPQYCAPTQRIARATLSAHLCMTPSPQLLQHEWARHGSCMAATPEAYFAVAAREYDRVHRPDMAALMQMPSLSALDVRRAFAHANPGLPMNAVAVRAGAGGWLDEVRLCLDRNFAWAACPVGDRGMSDGARVRVTPQP